MSLVFNMCVFDVLKCKSETELELLSEAELEVVTNAFKAAGMARFGINTVAAHTVARYITEHSKDHLTIDLEDHVRDRFYPYAPSQTEGYDLCAAIKKLPPRTVLIAYEKREEEFSELAKAGISCTLYKDLWVLRHEKQLNLSKTTIIL